MKSRTWETSTSLGLSATSTFVRDVSEFLAGRHATIAPARKTPSANFAN
jgi:hypothetical protein